MIPSKDKAAFLLSYEELLQRRLGKYEHVISVRPQQLVGRLTVEVNVLERSGITSLEVLRLQHSRQKGSVRGEGECGCRIFGAGLGRVLALQKPIKQLPFNKGSESLWESERRQRSKGNALYGFFNLFVLGERESVCASRGGSEREGEKKIPSRLCAVSAEPDHKIVT